MHWDWVTASGSKNCLCGTGAQHVRRVCILIVIRERFRSCEIKHEGKRVLRFV